MSGANPYDGSCALALPRSVESLPLHRWRPGARALVVGSRDGVSFTPDLARCDGNSFRRPLTTALVDALLARSGCRTLALAWSSTLSYPRAAAACLAASWESLLVCANGWGDPDLLEQLLPRAAAWLLAVGPEPGPLAARIVAGARHLEVLVGWRDPRAPLPPLAWERVAAIHLQPLAAELATAEALAAAYRAARAQWPGPLYDEAHRRDECPCGATLVWRAGARARRDALGDDARCRACGRAHAYALATGPASSGG